MRHQDEVATIKIFGRVNNSLALSNLHFFFTMCIITREMFLSNYLAVLTSNIPCFDSV